MENDLKLLTTKDELYVWLFLIMTCILYRILEITVIWWKKHIFINYFAKRSYLGCHIPDQITISFGLIKHYLPLRWLSMLLWARLVFPYFIWNKGIGHEILFFSNKNQEKTYFATSWDSEKSYKSENIVLHKNILYFLSIRRLKS